MISNSSVEKIDLRESDAALDAVPLCSFEQVFGDYRRLLIVAPHPDDEILPCGGLLALAAASGMPVRIVAVTDGEASHRGSRTISAEQLRQIRRAESKAALECLGIGSASVVRLAFADGAVDERADDLREILRDEIEARDAVLVPSRDDPHCDHAAVTRAAKAVMPGYSTLFELPIWMWMRLPDPSIDWKTSVRVSLPLDVQLKKKAAISAFASQTSIDPDVADTPILKPEFLEHFERPYELVFVA